MMFTLPKRQPPSRSLKKKNLYRLLIARSDIDAAHAACDLFLKTVTDLGDDLYYPLFTAIVVCYARPFTNNKPFGPLPVKWGVFRDPSQQKLHDSLIKTRNEIVAHSDLSTRKAMIVPPGTSIGFLNERELRSPKIGTMVNYFLFRIPQIREIPILTTDLGRRVNADIEVALEDLYGGMELPRAKFLLRITDGL
jgi:hypothetical protein